MAENKEKTKVLRCFSDKRINLITFISEHYTITNKNDYIDVI